MPCQFWDAAWHVATIPLRLVSTSMVGHLTVIRPTSRKQLGLPSCEAPWSSTLMLEIQTEHRKYRRLSRATRNSFRWDVGLSAFPQFWHFCILCVRTYQTVMPTSKQFTNPILLLSRKASKSINTFSTLIHLTDCSRRTQESKQCWNPPIQFLHHLGF